MTKPLRSKTVKIESLDPKLKKEMFTLFQEYYDDVDWERFQIDLSEKSHVFLFFAKQSGSLAGFSTILREKRPEISAGLFLYSGDTVMHKDFWGAKNLQKSFFWFIVQSKFMTPLSPLHWMLISKGHKTYLMMRKNFRHSYPNPSENTPDRFQKVQKAFYSKKFGECFNPDNELITFKEKLGSVKGGMAQPTEKQLKDQDTRYFLKRNPNFHQGVELACVCEIRFQDFLLHIPKFFLKLKKV